MDVFSVYVTPPFTAVRISTLEAPGVHIYNNRENLPFSMYITRMGLRPYCVMARNIVEVLPHGGLANFSAG